MDTSSSEFFSGENLRMAIFLVTLLTAVWGIVWSLNSSLEERMNDRFDKISAQLIEIDKRLDSFGERIAKNEARLDAR